MQQYIDRATGLRDDLLTVAHMTGEMEPLRAAGFLSQAINELHVGADAAAADVGQAVSA